MKVFSSALLAAALLFASTFAAAQRDARVRITNNSPVSIFYMYTSPTGSPAYGSRDLLDASGVRVLVPGESAVINFNHPDAGNKCVQDILAVGKDGRRWTWTMDVCEEVRWTLTN